jgi:thioredoxin-like negative regulator of GroEL
LAGQAALVQVNAEENPSLTSRFEVKSIPVMMLLRQGKVVDRFQGSRALDEVLSWFRRVA